MRIALFLTMLTAWASAALAEGTHHWQERYLSCISSNVIMNAMRSCIPPGDLLTAARSDCSGSSKMVENSLESRYILARGKLEAAKQEWNAEIEEYEGKVMSKAVSIQIERCP